MKTVQINAENWLGEKVDVDLYDDGVSFDVDYVLYRLQFDYSDLDENGKPLTAGVFHEDEEGYLQDIGVWGYHYIKDDYWTFWGACDFIDRSDKDPRLAAAKVICNI